MTTIKLFGTEFEVRIQSEDYCPNIENSFLFHDGTLHKTSLESRLKRIESYKNHPFRLTLSEKDYSDKPNPNIVRRKREFYNPEIDVTQVDGKTHYWMRQSRHNYSKGFLQMTSKDREYFCQQILEQTKDIDWKEIQMKAIQDLKDDLKERLEDYQKDLQRKVDKLRESMKMGMELFR